MYITASLFNVLKKQFEDVQVFIPHIPEESTSKIDADVLGQFIESIVIEKSNNRIGLETGFNIPVTVTGVIYTLYQNCSTVEEFFEKSALYSPIVNTICKYTSRVENDLFYHEMEVDKQFKSKYPSATRQLYEAQIGVSLQLLYSLTGKRLIPIKVFSAYEKEGEKDLIEAYLSCPILYAKEKLSLVFNKSILDLPILTANKEFLPLLEKLIESISFEKTEQSLSQSVRNYLIQGISSLDISLKSTAWRYNMSERNIQRKLKEENTSFQKILDDVRKDLADLYLKKKIPFSDIYSLLGFDSQSAFNKFFKKHFDCTPGHYSSQQIK